MNAAETINSPAGLEHCQITDLDPNHTYHKNLGFGYEVEAAADLCDEGICMGTCYNLTKDSAIKYTFDVPQTEISIQEETIFRYLKPYLEIDAGKDMADWILQRQLNIPKNTPPWLRDKSIRQIKINLPTETANPYYKEILNHEITKAKNTLTDVGNAERFKQEADGWLIYDKDSKEWFAWSGNHWEPAEDNLGKTELFVSNTIKEEIAFWEGVTVSKDDENHSKKLNTLLERYAGHYQASCKNHNLKAMTDICSRSTMTVNLKKDSDSDILTFKNGALNTRTGELIPIWKCDSLKEKYPTAYIDCEYTEEDSEIWEQHLQKIFTDNTTPNLSEKEREERMLTTVKYFKRLLGYSLYAGNPEQIIVFLWGEGLNGKSATLDAVKKVFGSEKLDVTCRELFTSNDDRARSGITNALSKRLMILTEAGKADNSRKDIGIFSSSAIKILTGEKKTSEFRRMYKEAEEDARILCLPLATTNALPRFDNTDKALLRRLVTIPFQHIITEEERDEHISEKLEKDADKIFSMIVRELQEYTRKGLYSIPKHFTTTRLELLVGSKVCTFLIQEYEESENQSTTGQELQRSFQEWCSLNGYDVGTKKSQYEDERGYIQSKLSLTRGEVLNLYLGAREMYGSYKSAGNEKFKCKPIRIIKV